MRQFTSLVRCAVVIGAVALFSSNTARAGYITTVLADNPIALYHLAETSGTTMVDSIGGQNGTYSSGVTLNAAGPQPPTFKGLDFTNTAGQFDGTTNSKSVVPSITGLSNTTYSVEVFFKYSSIKLQYLFGRGSGASLSYDAIGLNNTGLGFYNGAETNTFATPVGVSTNAWHHLVFTRDGTAVKLYLDGAQVISVTSTITFGTSSRMVLGDRPADLGTLNPAGFFDEFAIYNTALTPGQVTAHYLASLPEPGGATALLGIGATALVRRRQRKL